MKTKSKHIELFGMKYKIIFVPEDHEKLRGDSENDGYYAVVAHTKNKIYVRNNITKRRLNKTLLHEILHAIDSELYLSMSHKQIYRLAAGLSGAGVKVKCIR